MVSYSLTPWYYGGNMPFAALVGEYAAEFTQCFYRGDIYDFVAELGTST